MVYHGWSTLPLAAQPRRAGTPLAAWLRKRVRVRVRVTVRVRVRVTVTVTVRVRERARSTYVAQARLEIVTLGWVEGTRAPPLKQLAKLHEELGRQRAKEDEARHATLVQERWGIQP